MDLVDEIHMEHKRWIDSIGKEDPYIGRGTVGIFEVLKAHFLLAEYFFRRGEGIGGLGPKNLNLLHSALSRQFVSYDGRPKWVHDLDICSTLMFGLIKNHPFHDANKRTAFLVSLLHLQKIGRTPILSHQEYEDFTVDIAENNLSKYVKLEQFPESVGDREIKIISHFLKRNTREIDIKERIITYNQLDTILRKFKFKLDHPRGNRIDVTTVFPPYKRVAHIGFHGWSREISRKDLHIVRSATKLTTSHGYDSQSFFYGVEDPISLIKKYEEPLRRLAFR